MKLDEDALEAAARAQAIDVEDIERYDREPCIRRAYLVEARTMVTAYLAAMRKKGWAMRPREATVAMQHVGATAIIDTGKSDFWDSPIRTASARLSNAEAARVWAAQWDAAKED